MCINMNKEIDEKSNKQIDKQAKHLSRNNNGKKQGIEEQTEQRKREKKGKEKKTRKSDKNDINVHKYNQRNGRIKT